MRITSKFREFSPWGQTGAYIGSAVIAYLLVSNAAALAAFGIWGRGLWNSVAGLLFVQFFSSAGGFLLPALLLQHAMKTQSSDFLHLEKMFRSKEVAVALCAYILLAPLVSGLSDWAQTWHLEESSLGVLRWLHTKSMDAERLTGKLLQAEGGMFGWVLLVVGAGAGICEEFFFRGGIQGLLEKCLRNRHAAVWAGAAVFSLVHLDPYGFLPRWLLGAFLGYACLYSRSLWLPVLLHTLNNICAACMERLEYARAASAFPQGLDPLPKGLIIAACSLLLLTLWLHVNKKART